MSHILPDHPSTPDTRPHHRVRVRRRACPPWCHLVTDDDTGHRHGPTATLTTTAGPVLHTARVTVGTTDHVELVTPAGVVSWHASDVPGLTIALSVAQQTTGRTARALCDLNGIGHDVCVHWVPVIVGPVLPSVAPVVRVQIARRPWARPVVMVGPSGGRHMYALTTGEAGRLADMLAAAAGICGGAA